MENGYRAEVIDTRWVFRAYAGLAGVAGLLLIAWGPMWFGIDLPGQPFGKAALIRAIGAIVVAAGCCAAGFASIDHPYARQRGLRWFALGHFIVWQIIVLQRVTIWGPGVAKAIELLLLMICVTLWTVRTGESEFDPSRWKIISLFSAGSNGPVSLRSQYEQQIREAAKLEERNRLARDLHDSIKQQIFVIQTAAATAQARLEGSQSGVAEALQQVRGSAREAMTEMQVMLDQLKATPLENSGLIESLKKQCEALGFRTGAQVEFKLGHLPDSQAAPPGVHDAIQRVVQEALANVGRHARAQHVVVSLGSASGYLEVTVKDDGAGFDPNSRGQGQGIANMRARAEEFGGRFELTSQPTGGTAVSLRVPLTEARRLHDHRRGIMCGLAIVATLPLLAWNTERGLLVMATIYIGAVVFRLFTRKRTEARP